MKVILLENILHKGQRHKAGASLELDAEMAERFERSGVAIIEAAPKAVPVISRVEPVTPKGVGTATELPQAERKEARAGSKPSRSKKGARGQK